MVRKSLALIAIALPLALVACGGGDDTTSTTAASSETTSADTSTTASGGETVAISETEFKLDPADPTAKAGTVDFAVTNDGTTTHNLEIEGDGVEEVTDDIAPGDSADLAVDLQPGTYEIYCTIDSHRDQGMEGEVTVQ